MIRNQNKFLFTLQSIERSAAVLVPPLLINSNQNFEREKLETVSQELCARITKIGHKYRSEGITIESIKYFYHKEFCEPLDLHKLGFQLIENLITDVLSAKYPIEIRDDNKGFKRLYSDLKEYYYWLSGIKVSKKFDLLDIMVDVPEISPLLANSYRPLNFLIILNLMIFLKYYLVFKFCYSL